MQRKGKPAPSFYYSIIMFFKIMKWSVILAKEREITINVDNINQVVEKANGEIKEGERIVSIRINKRDV